MAKKDKEKKTRQVALKDKKTFTNKLHTILGLNKILSPIPFLNFCSYHIQTREYIHYSITIPHLMLIDKTLLKCPSVLTVLDRVEYIFPEWLSNFREPFSPVLG